MGKEKQAWRPAISSWDTLSMRAGVPMARTGLRAFGDRKVSCEVSVSREVRLVGLKCGGGYAISSASQLPGAFWHARMDPYSSFSSPSAPWRIFQAWPRGIAFAESTAAWSVLRAVDLWTERRDDVNFSSGGRRSMPVQWSSCSPVRCPKADSGSHRTFQRQSLRLTLTTR